MHHMTSIRKDLKLKYDSTSQATLDRSKINVLVDNIKSIGEDNLIFNETEFEIVENYFGINI